MNHRTLHSRPPWSGGWPLAVCSALLAVLAGCNSDDDAEAAPVSNGSLSAEQIAAAQAAVEPPIFVVDAGASAPTAAQIDSQRAALDGSTTDGAATIGANQTALDAAAGLTPAF